MLRFVTAGESHGQALVAWLSGLPAGLPVDFGFVNRELHRRQLGYGRGGRQKIEKDKITALAGVRHGQTIGAPIALQIENRDWANWQNALPVEDTEGAEDTQRKLTAPRPGHADLAAALKFNWHDARYALERASARETAARVAAGAFAKLLLREFGAEVLSHVVAVGKVKLERAAVWDEIVAICGNLDSPLRCVDAATEAKMKREVDAVLRAGDSAGGIFEVVAHHVLPGLGSHAQWDEKLDGRLAQAVMSIQAVKAVEIGGGVASATSYGAEVQDEIRYDAAKKRYVHATNRAGGLEGGITNGEDVIVRGYLKPISTLRRPLQTADLVSKEAVKAAYERSDVCVVPAAGVVGEAMVALSLAAAFLEKFGGDSLAETRRNFESYQQQLDEF
ncbi:MAG: chorismate synthase [Acidobacteria bacterium]|nr:chorismate synthase [Acidobacteriota bacterium]MBI3663713.1 chorismate synthase [Acidobacteriota bacterium]